jgi:zinc D-Ala-D-Ala carboxypeptidase
MGIVTSSENFSTEELRCKFTQECAMDSEFMEMLQNLRNKWQRPMRLSSAYRSPSHPRERSKETPGYHALGRAADILIYGDAAVEFLKMAINEGFTGIGINQKGQFNQRFIHLDNRENPRIWSY